MNTPPGTRGIFFVYQIFYDQLTRQALDPGFIPLDNTRNERPDWFEFWVIRNFLRNNALQENAWYGFLSTKFFAKTGLRSDSVLPVLEENHTNLDVILLSPHWDQLAYFQSPYEQGELWHPGLSSLSQQFFDAIGCQIDLERLVTHSGSAVFSNYVIARPDYWRKWLDLADRLFEFAEGNASHGEDFRQGTSYGSRFRQSPMKTFIQERFPSVILSRESYRVLSLNKFKLPWERLFTSDLDTYRALQTCDFLKERYCRTKDDDFLHMYRKVRGTIHVKAPVQ